MAVFGVPKRNIVTFEVDRAQLNVESEGKLSKDRRRWIKTTIQINC